MKVLDLSVSSSSWGLGGAAVCDCGTPWTFLLPFLLMQVIVRLSVPYGCVVVYSRVNSTSYRFQGLERVRFS